MIQKMTIDWKKRVIKNYHYLELKKEPEIFSDIKNLCDSFKKDGEARFLSTMEVYKHKPIGIRNLKTSIDVIIVKMNAEYKEAEKNFEPFILSFGTPCNNYYESFLFVLDNIKDSMSGLNTILLKTQSPTKFKPWDIQRLDIKPKTLIENSPLGAPACQKHMFPISEESEELQEFYKSFTAFFDILEKLITLCKSVLEREKATKQNRDACYDSLLRSRQRAFEKALYMFNIIMNKETIEILKKFNPAYLERLKYNSDIEFAQAAYHQFHEGTLDHFHLIEYYDMQVQIYSQYSEFELEAWEEPEEIEKKRNVVKEFDNLLPSYFTETQMGQYVAYFCKWAYETDIKNVHQFFKKNYTGKYKVTGYSSVCEHIKKINTQSVEYRQFVDRIGYLTSKPINLSESTGFSTGLINNI